MGTASTGDFTVLDQRRNTPANPSVAGHQYYSDGEKIVTDKAHHSDGELRKNEDGVGSLDAIVFESSSKEVLDGVQGPSREMSKDLKPVLSKVPRSLVPAEISTNLGQPSADKMPTRV